MRGERDLAALYINSANGDGDGDGDRDVDPTNKLMPPPPPNFAFETTSPSTNVSFD